MTRKAQDVIDELVEADPSALIPKQGFVYESDIDRYESLRLPGWREALYAKAQQRTTFRGKPVLILALEDLVEIRRQYNAGANTEAVRKDTTVLRAFKEPGFAAALAYIFESNPPVVMPEFEELRRAYQDDYQQMGGDTCSNCSLTKLKSLYRDKLAASWKFKD